VGRWSDRAHRTGCRRRWVKVCPMSGRAGG
jgi:hypothetical protein